MSEHADRSRPPSATTPSADGSGAHALNSVAIVGPPNSGKSTLFNQLTGLRQKVANYPGVTVEKRVGRLRLAHNREIDLIDLPGVYSLDPRSEDERITHDLLAGRMKGIPRPDAVVLILDCSTTRITPVPRTASSHSPLLRFSSTTL